MAFRYKNERDGEMRFTVEKVIDNLGRVVVPKYLRDYYGISANDKLMFIPTEEGILITKANEKANEK